MYAIRADAARRIMYVDVTGFWTTQTVALFARDLGQDVAALGPPWGSHRIFSDFTGAELVTQPVIDALQALILNAPVRADRIGYYAASSLARMQLRRIAAVRDMIRIFDDPAAARAWILEDRQDGFVTNQPAPR